MQISLAKFKNRKPVRIEEYIGIEIYVSFYLVKYIPEFVMIPRLNLFYFIWNSILVLKKGAVRV